MGCLKEFLSGKTFPATSTKIGVCKSLNRKLITKRDLHSSSGCVTIHMYLYFYSASKKKYSSISNTSSDRISESMEVLVKY